jgi:putative hydrolase of the HAD superfamily
MDAGPLSVLGLTGTALGLGAVWSCGGRSEIVGREIDTLIFDIDDTLYPIESGFTGHRNGTIVQDFMVQHCGFATREAARLVRDEYFARYHSTTKALVVAAAEGALPAGARCLQDLGGAEKALGDYWAQKCEFRAFLTPAIEPPLIEALAELKALGLKLVIFTNAPKAYGLRVLETLQLRQFFQTEHIFAVDDVLPACKPEPVAFQKVLDQVGSVASRCVMFEDSMKNIRGCKKLGIGTILLTGTPGKGGDASSKLDDLPSAQDPAVDAVLREC